MDLGSYRHFRAACTSLAMGVVVATSIAFSHSVDAGGFGGLRGGAVGGVMIDSEGVVRNASVEEQQDFAGRVRALLDSPSGDLNEAVDLRVVSLRGVQDAISQSAKAGAPLPDEVSLLAGLQRIEYVLVDEGSNDILIAGPAEPWKLMQDGSIVGTKTGGATLRLDDLAVALQSVEAARDGLITCSIEPTANGRRQLNRMLRNITIAPGQDPSRLVPAMKEAFGPQQVKLNGVPGKSRMARTLVAADFEMKRIAMGLTDSPIAGLPSYLQMARNAAHSRTSNPRWWMACDYDSLRRSPDGLAWKIEGPGVKTMTDTDVFGADGATKGGGNQDKIAKRWADQMTKQYSELSKQMTVFSDLRNVMDLNLVATLIVQEGLAQRANLDVSVLASENDSLGLGSYFVPETIPPHCSFIQGASGWVVTASGGVEINAFTLVQNQTEDDAVANLKTDALAAKTSDGWWWNR